MLFFPRNKGTGVWCNQNFTSHHFGHLCFDPCSFTDNSQELFWALILRLFLIHLKLPFLISSQCVTASACFQNPQRFWGINSALCGGICLVLLLFLALVRTELLQLLHRTLSNYQNLNRLSLQKDQHFPGKNLTLKKKSSGRPRMTENIWNIPQERSKSKAEDLCGWTPLFVCGIIINGFHLWEELKHGINS